MNDPSHHPAREGGFRPVVPRRLPVFICERDEYAIFYAPRFVCVLPRSLAAGIESRIGHLSATGRHVDAESQATARNAATRIVQAARNAGNEAANPLQAAFSPECLTLFLNNACNLTCRYCHAAPEVSPDRSITDDAIRSASRLVAASCARRKMPFTVAFHGGGEPSLDESHVDRILEIVRDEARSGKAVLRTYIATNGVMSEKRARWLAGRFDLVGLSCDGPPDVQDWQRPARNGRPTSFRVGRTAAILRQTGSPFLVRATITKETLGRQAEITAYFIEEYAPAEIRLEPVYVNPATKTEHSRDDASLFVAGFMEAWKLAAARHVQVTTSLALPASLYGRHCNVLRQVLNLVPGDIATGCFLESWEADIDRRQVRIGAVNPGSGRFELHPDRITTLLARCSEIPPCCRDCPCCFQCSHGCPDVCALEALSNPATEKDIMMGFRCQSSRLLMEALIREAAEKAWRHTPPGVDQDVLSSETRLKVAVYRGASSGDAET